MPSYLLLEDGVSDLLLEDGVSKLVIEAPPTNWRAQFETALGSVATTPVNIVCLGDSVTERQGAATRGAGWTSKVSDYMHLKYPVAAGGEGYLAAETWTYGPDSPWRPYTTLTGTVTFLSTVGSLGYRAEQMATNATLTYTVTGTSVDIWWQRNTGNGTFTYQIDGGTVSAGISTAGTKSSTTKTTVSLGAAGSHTVKITATTGPVILMGLTVFNGDETKGVRVFEGGRCAWTSNDYINHADYAQMIAQVASLAPDLVTIQLGLNDYGSNTVTPAQYKTNLLTLIASLDALPKRPSILLIDSYDFGPSVGNNGNTATQADYKARVVEVVDADPEYRGFLDFGVSMPPTDTTGTGYYRTDAVHPNDSGHNEIARQVINRITPDGLGQVTYASETFPGTSGSWPAQWTMGAQAGTAVINASGQGAITNPATTYGVGKTAHLSGMQAVVDQELTGSVGFADNLEQYVDISLRTTGAITSATSIFPLNGYYLSLYPNDVAYEVGRVVNGTRTILANPTHTYTAGVRQNFRFRLIGSSISVKVWEGATEPAGWDYSAVDAAPYLTAGRLLLSQSNGSPTTAKTVTYDNILITDGSSPVAVLPAPGAPTGLTVTPQPGQVLLTWNQPTDAGSYTIRRGGTIIASNVTELSYVDATGVQGTTYSYTVSSINATGAGPQSTAATGASTVLTPMTRWHASLATITTAPAVWVAAGDSVTEGQGATTKPARWLDVAKSGLRTAYPSGATGGDNYLASGYFTYAESANWARPGATTGTVTDSAAYGSLGYRTVVMSQGATWQATVTGTSVDIWYGVGGGTLTYSIDGGTGVQVNTAGTYDANSRVLGVSLGAAGSHTVRITATTGTTYFNGLTVDNGDEAKGVQVYDSAHTGFTTTDHLSDALQEQGAWADLAPDLVTIMLGLNDSGTSGIPLATYKSNLQAMVNNLKALPKIPSILFIAAYNPAPEVDWTTATYQTYVQGMKDVAAANPAHVAVLDLSAVMPTATTSGTGFYSTDGLHPNNSGHTEIANRVRTAISPAAGIPSGSADAAIVFGSTATGAKVTSGQAGVVVMFGSTATGSRTSSGSASPGVTFGSTAVGSRTSTGSSSVAIVFGSTAVGSRTSSGSASTGVLYGSTASGATQTSGSASVGVTFSSTADGSAPGVAPNSGSADAVVVFGSTATGSRASSGNASTGVTLGSTATGSTVKSGSTTVGITLGSTATGSRASNGNATTGVVFGSTADGSAPVVGGASGSASAGVTFGSTAVGSRVSTGQVDATIVYSSTAVGSTAKFGSTTTSIVFSSGATGGSATGGSATVGVTFGSTATGSRTSSGQVDAAVTFGSTASGTAPVVGQNSGSASTGVTFGSTATGSRISSGSSSASVAFGSTANGSAPAVAGNSGSASVGVTFGSTAVGSKVSTGVATAQVVYTTVATGSRTSSGSATTSVTFVATTDGTTTPLGVKNGSANATVQFSAAATGSRVSRGSAVAGVAFGVVAVGRISGTIDLSLEMDLPVMTLKFPRKVPA